MERNPDAHLGETIFEFEGRISTLEANSKNQGSILEKIEKRLDEANSWLRGILLSSVGALIAVVYELLKNHK